MLLVLYWYGIGMVLVWQRYNSDDIYFFKFTIFIQFKTHFIYHLHTTSIHSTYYFAYLDTLCHFEIELSIPQMRHVSYCADSPREVKEVGKEKRLRVEAFEIRNVFL